MRNNTVLVIGIVLGLTMIVIGLSGLLYSYIGSSNRVEAFSNECQKAGGFVTEIGLAFKTRYSCSVTSLNHF